MKLTAEFPSDTNLGIVMRPAAMSLAAVRVEAGSIVRSLDLSGFCGRMEEKAKGASTWHFLTPEESRRRPSPASRCIREATRRRSFSC